MSNSVSDDGAEPTEPLSLNQIVTTIWARRGSLINALWRKCYDKELAEWAITQATSEFFIQQAETSLSFTHENQVRAWLLRAAGFFVLKELDERRRWTTLDELAEGERREPQPGHQHLQGSIPSLETLMTVRDIRRLLEQFPAEDREILEGQLRDDAPPLTVTERSQLLRARRRCRPWLVAEGLLPPRATVRPAKRKRARK